LASVGESRRSSRASYEDVLVNDSLCNRLARPFGYLERLRADLGAEPISSAMPLVEDAADPSEALRQLFLQQDPRL